VIRTPLRDHACCCEPDGPRLLRACTDKILACQKKLVELSASSQNNAIHSRAWELHREMVYTPPERNSG
jgi:hypothetical protein